jgi:hypothetical protein
MYSRNCNADRKYPAATRTAKKSGNPTATGHQIYRRRASQPVGLFSRIHETIPPENRSVNPKNIELAIIMTINASSAIELLNAISLTVDIAEIRKAIVTATGVSHLRLPPAAI